MALPVFITLGKGHFQISSAFKVRVRVDILTLTLTTRPGSTPATNSGREVQVPQLRPKLQVYPEITSFEDNS